MAVAVIDEDGANRGIHFISLPSVDLRDFCDDELRLVAQFSGHFPDADFRDVVDPRIDRSCFNESAGSRRQTYNAPGSSKRHRNRGVRPSAISAAITYGRHIGLTSTRGTKAAARLTSHGKVTEKMLASQVVLKRGSPAGRIVEGDMGLFSRKKLKPSSEAFNNSEYEGASRRRNRKRSCTGRGLGEEGFERSKRFRGSSRDTLRGLLFESRQLEFHQRPLVASKRVGEGEMMERLARMKGKWSCNAKTRKIVYASGFPVGWTVRVGLRCKDGRTLLEYRDWRSPDGIQWSSFKDASAFLLASLGRHSTPENVVLLKLGQRSSRVDGISTAKEVRADDTEGGCNHLTNIISVAALMDSRKFWSLRLRESLDEPDAVSKGHIFGELCSEQVSVVNLDQSIGGSPTVDKARPETEVEGPSNKLTLESHDRQMLNDGNKHESGHDCRDFMATALDLSKDADLKEFLKNSYLGCPTWLIDNGLNSSHSNNNVAQGCMGLAPSYHLTDKFSSCGPMFSTLFKLRGHLRRTDRGSYAQCDVCSRHFSYVASLFSHRTRMGHPRVARVTHDSRRVQAKRSERGTKLRRSKMFNIVLGLLSDTSRGLRLNIDHASVSGKSSKSTESLKSTDTQRSVHEEVRQNSEKTEGILDSFECKTCSKVFSLQSQYWGHLSSHSKHGNLKSRSTLKIVKTEVKQTTAGNGGLSGAFECRSCDKVFSLQSQYWGHLSSHSKQKKKAAKPSGVVEMLSKRSLSQVVGQESNGAMIGRENRGCAGGDNYSGESVFWRLLNDSLP